MIHSIKIFFYLFIVFNTNKEQILDKQADKKVLIVGMGKTGQAARKFLENRKIEAVCFDDQRAGDIHDVKLIPWKEIDYMIQSPGIALDHEVCKAAQHQHIPILSDVDVFNHAVPQAVRIGITGTNGKSTTTALIYHILKQHFPRVVLGGNIGNPVLDLPIYPNGIYVLELSSYQLSLSHSLNLDVAVWTNLTEDHLERHKTLENYIAAKKRIFDAAKLAIIGVDDADSAQVFAGVKSVILAYSVSTHHQADCYLSEHKDVIWRGTRTIQLANHPFLFGDHNFQNMLLAYGVGKTFGIADIELEKSIKNFQGLPHRIEIVTESQGITFVNDSKATNAESTIKALNAFKGRPIYLIAGGKAKHDGIAPVIPYMDDVQEIFLIGDASERFAKELDGKKIYHHCHVLERALRAAFDAAKQKKSFSPVVLLSPVCASFDQFKSFEERGDVFKQYVRALTSELS